ncbi:MAG: ShlB/FhaC/HecB family hemolysin secretion/activation protein, partial [Cyanobacteria bacterium J06649_4]
STIYQSPQPLSPSSISTLEKSHLTQRSDNSTQLSQRLDPTEDGFLQPLPDPDAERPIEGEPVLPSQEQTPPDAVPVPDDPAGRLFVNRIEVVGSTVFEPMQLEAITQPLEGREVALTELIQAADAIAQLYFSAGYINSTAIVGEQEVEDGVVQISVTEGRLQDIQVEGLQRLKPGYIRSRMRHADNVPLNANQIEEQLRLLRADANIADVRAQLNPGDRPGESILVVQVTEEKAWSAGVGIDNYSPPSVGSERMQASLGYRNLSGLGDTLGVTYYRTTIGGSNIWDATYQVPVNAMDGTVSLRAVLNNNQVTQSGAIPFSVDGNSERYEVSFRQPLVRRLQDEFALSFGYSYRDGETLVGLGDAGIASTERSTNVFKFGQDYTHRDTTGTWALRSQFNLGFASQDITDPGDNSAASEDSTFLSWLGQAQRVQVLGRDHLLIAQGDLQLSVDDLPPSEQYVLGGGQSLRGYRQNARIGDNALRFSVEDRITITREDDNTPVWQLAPFVDLGLVWNSGNSQLSTEQNFLAGIGIGSLLTPAEGLTLRLDYALPLIDLDDRGRNAQDDGFYFNVNYRY